MNNSFKVTKTPATILLVLYFMMFSFGVQQENIYAQEKSVPVVNKIQSSTSEKRIKTVRRLHNTTVIINVNKLGRSHTATGIFAKRGEKAYIWTVAHTFEITPRLNLSAEQMKARVDAGLDIIAPKKILGSVGDTALITFLYRVKNDALPIQTTAKVIAISSEGDQDLALLELFIPAKIFPANPVEWHNDPVEAGLDTYHIGHLRGRLDYSVMKGIISSDYRRMGNKSFYQTDHSTVQGGSGGGVFVQETGKCVGLMARIDVPGISFAIPSSRIKKFAKSKGYEWIYDHSLPIPEKMPEDYPEFNRDKEFMKNLVEKFEKAIKRIDVLKKSDK